MCLVLIAHQMSEQRPLVVLANRDEFYARPTTAAQPWHETPGMIAGRDLVSAGTWFGVRNNRWATVTNIRQGVRDKTNHSSKSRGWLVRDFLQGDLSPQEFFANLSAKEEYAGFNLLLGDHCELWYATSADPHARQLTPGIYGLSNHLLDTPWPKVVRGKEGLAKLMSQPTFSCEAAFTLLADTARAADRDLPETGIPLEWERALSATFITMPTYGTRSSSLLMTEASGQRLFVERHFKAGTLQWDASEFSWPSQPASLDR